MQNNNTPKHEAAIRLALSVYMDSSAIDKSVAFVTSPSFDQYSEKGWKLVSMIKRAKYNAASGAGMTSKEKSAVTRAMKHFGF